MSRVAILIHDDTHSDTEVTVYATPELAVAAAKVRAREFDRFGDLREELTPSMERSGWLYFASYGESNHIRVEAREVRTSV